MLSIGSYVVPTGSPSSSELSTRTPSPRRLAQQQGAAAGRQEAAGRVLGVDPRLDGVPGQPHVVLAERQGLAGGDAQLLLDEVEAGDQLGDRVLDLQPGVHLHEERLVGGVAGDDELDRAGAGVADRLAVATASAP